MLEVEGLVRRTPERVLLSVETLALERGRRLAIVGPNGSGKSTLLRLLALLDDPDAGTIRLDGAPVRTASERRAARRRVTLVEQRPFLFRGSVLENVTYGLAQRGIHGGEAGRRAREALGALDAESLAARDARALSDGETQRVAVARALAVRPDVLLLDEPVSAADRAAQRSLYSAIVAAQQQHPMAVGVASHQLEDAYRWADRILALHAGNVSPVTPENLFRIDLPAGAGLKTIRLGALAVDVPSEKSGACTLAIPVDEIILSRSPLDSSARNTVAGRIVRVAEQGAAVRVTVEGMGVELVALITRRSYEEMGLAVGAGVHASFKSVALRVF